MSKVLGTPATTMTTASAENGDRRMGFFEQSLGHARQSRLRGCRRGMVFVFPRRRSAARLLVSSVLARTATAKGEDSFRHRRWPPPGLARPLAERLALLQGRGRSGRSRWGPSGKKGIVQGSVPERRGQDEGFFFGKAWLPDATAAPDLRTTHKAGAKSLRTTSPDTVIFRVLRPPRRQPKR